MITPGFNHQKDKTSAINRLASGLNKVVRHYCNNFKPPDFYPSLQRRIRQEPSLNRFLQLKQLRGMDIHPTYAFTRLGFCRTTVSCTKNEIKVELITTSHPQPGLHRADAYYYEVILFLWNKGSENDEVQHSIKRSSAIDLGRDNVLPAFDFPFDRPAATVHWLLGLRQQLLAHDKRVEAFVGEAMMFVDAGTFDKKDEELLAKKNADREKESIRNRIRPKEEEKIPIVEPKAKSKPIGPKGKKKKG